MQGIIDHIMVGHFVGYTGNAAIGVSWQIFLVVIAFGVVVFATCVVAQFGIVRLLRPHWARMLFALVAVAAEAGARPYDNGVVMLQIGDLRDGRCLIELEVTRLCDLFRHRFRNTLDVDGRARQASTLGDRVRHRLDVSIG